MKSAYNLRTGSKVVLNHDIVTRDLTTETETVYTTGTVGVVDAVFRKDGVERVYVVFDGPVVVLHSPEVIDNADEQ